MSSATPPTRRIGRAGCARRSRSSVRRSRSSASCCRRVSISSRPRWPPSSHASRTTSPRCPSHRSPRCSSASWACRSRTSSRRSTRRRWQRGRSPRSTGQRSRRANESSSRCSVPTPSDRSGRTFACSRCSSRRRPAVGHSAGFSISRPCTSTSPSRFSASSTSRWRPRASCASARGSRRIRGSGPRSPIASSRRAGCW